MTISGFILIVYDKDGRVVEYPCRLMPWGPQSMDALRQHWDRLREHGGHPPRPICAISATTDRILHWYMGPTPALRMAVMAIQEGVA